MIIATQKLLVDSDTFIGEATLTLSDAEGGDGWGMTLEQEESCMEEDQDITHVFITDSMTEEDARKTYNELISLKSIGSDDFEKYGLWYL